MQQAKDEHDGDGPSNSEFKEVKLEYGINVGGKGDLNEGIEFRRRGIGEQMKRRGDLQWKFKDVACREGEASGRLYHRVKSGQRADDVAEDVIRSDSGDASADTFGVLVG